MVFTAKWLPAMRFPWDGGMQLARGKHEGSVAGRGSLPLHTLFRVQCEASPQMCYVEFFPILCNLAV